MNFIPTILESTSNNNIAYDLYSRLMQERIIFINSEINNFSSSIIIGQLLYLDSLNHDDIHIYINSPGGEVFSGLAICDTIDFIKSDVKTIVIGLAASMAAIILACGTKGKRCSLKNSQIMIHQPLGGVSGQATDIKIVAENIIKLKDKLNKLLASKTKQSLKKIINDADRDYYMSASEALTYGLIDYIL